jgi:uncharacterized sulfatase
MASNLWSRRALLGALSSAPLVRALEKGGKRPNVLFIVSDDMNLHLGCYGHPVKSPNLDALARSGVRFERPYCQYPLCNPSRTSLLTGRRPPHTGIFSNTTWFRTKMPDVVTLPKYFKDNGYVTAQTGKVFHEGLGDLEAWTIGGKPATAEAQARPTKQKMAKGVANMDRIGPLNIAEEDDGDWKVATHGIELLDQLKQQSQPFFLAVGLHHPHAPLTAPKKYFDLYDPSKIKLPADFRPEPEPGPEFRTNYDLYNGRKCSEQQAREAIAAYYACASLMDAQVGRVVDALDRLRLRDNTIIVFWGDNGWHLGEKGFWSKMTLLEPSAAVPLIFSGPGVAKPGTSCPRPVEFLDIYPTLVDICGLPPKKDLEGASLTPLLKNPNAAWDKPAYTFMQKGGYLAGSVRTQRYRYTEWDEQGKVAELYDYDTDPGEDHNLASDPKHKQTVAMMQRLLREKSK